MQECALGQDPVKALLEQAIQARGGEVALARFPASQLKVKGTLQGAKEASFVQEVIAMPPSRVKQTLELEVNGKKETLITVFNGDSGWLSANGKTIDMDGKTLAQLREGTHLMRVERLVSLRENGFQLSMAGEGLVNGRPAVGLKVSCKGYRDIFLYFEKETKLLSKVERWVVDPATGKDVGEEQYLSNFLEVDGIGSPTKTVIYRDSRKYLEADVTEIKHLEKPDNRIFQKP
jgi:hypothetical protein